GQNFDSSTHSLWSRKNSVPTFVEFACPQLYCTNERRDGRVRVPITACDKAQTRTGFEFSDRHRRSHYRFGRDRDSSVHTRRLELCVCTV
ncbi:hypothetical protein M404DRAFT_1002516, partial [Pisolithus tinctorius Marx 270]